MAAIDDIFAAKIRWVMAKNWGAWIGKWSSHLTLKIS